MPAIWNVGNLNGIGNKKMSSKLTFEVGESFKGKIISEDSDGGAVIKLANGWEFSAEIVGEEALEKDVSVRFQVDGFENGKLKLKIVQDETSQSNNTESDIVGAFIKNEGLSKSDEGILRAMIKYKIPLTKENISFVKSLLSFNEKANKADGEIEKFIESYIAARGMDGDISEANNIRESLNNFFESYKTLSKDDILLFLENNIEVNKENIDSYNKLYKSEDGVNNFFKDIRNEIDELNSINSSGKEFVNLDGENNELTGINKEIENINSKNIEEDTNRPVINKISALKIYDSNSLSKAKISMVSLLKSLGNTKNEIVKDSVKNIVIDNKNNFTNSELKNIFSKLDDLSEKDLVLIIKNNLSSDEGLSKENISKALSNVIGKEIKLSDDVSEKFKQILDFKLFDNEFLEGEDKEQVLKNLNMKDYNSNIAGENISENIELPLKAAEAKEIIESNVKLESLKLGDQEVEKIIDNELKNLSSEIIKDDVKAKLEEIKEILRNTITRTQISSENSEKIMDFIKSNINDFKLLNLINNEYYYLDLPINVDNQKYPCKLIIKDDRKGNKDIDKNNIKIVVAVKTLNLGTVDGYLSVHDKNLNVELKCKNEFVDVIKNGTDILTKTLHSLGYLVNISVSKKEEEVSLTSCRTFFNDVNTSVIDTKV